MQLVIGMALGISLLAFTASGCIEMTERRPPEGLLVYAGVTLFPSDRIQLRFSGWRTRMLVNDFAVRSVDANTEGGSPISVQDWTLRRYAETKEQGAVTVEFQLPANCSGARSVVLKLQTEYRGKNYSFSGVLHADHEYAPRMKWQMKIGSGFLSTS